MPLPCSVPAAMTGSKCARAPAPSVTFTASASPLSGAALAMRTERSLDAGGVISAVSTKRPSFSRCSSWLRPPPKVIGPVSGRKSGLRSRMQCVIFTL